jgi:hypothetical protein
MDKIAQLTMMANTEVIKEPRGFIKFIQIVIAIFAFATTTAYYGTTQFQVVSNNGTCPCSLSFDFGYAFKLSQSTIQQSPQPSQSCCVDLSMVSMYGDFSAPSQFYVFVGVMAFLYSLAALLLYVFADDKYRQIDSIPAADLVITVIFVILWLIASSAWADGVTKVKYYSSSNALINSTSQVEWSCNAQPQCTSTSNPSFASLNVSIIFGFLNMCVWGGNIWFLYKETKWFGGGASDPSASAPPPQQQGSPDSPQQRI